MTQKDVKNSKICKRKVGEEEKERSLETDNKNF
jgi:hypothetical protein